MKIILDLAKGPFKNETEFKGEVIRRLSFLHHGFADWFCLETEETVPGMPDALRVCADRPVRLVEFKISDDDGKIKFKRSQPLFYRLYRHRGYDISVYAWDRRFDRAVYITTDEVIANKSLTLQLPSEISHGLRLIDKEIS